MEYVILGLLLLRSQTLYELNGAFKRGVSLFYSASYGSLQTTLKKLLAKGLIDFAEEIGNGRRKKVYAVLPEGREAFFAWMSAETPENKLEVTVLSKVYFLGLVEGTEGKCAILTEIASRIDRELEQLESVDRGLDHVRVQAEHMDIFHYHLHTLQYGIGSHRFAREWVAGMLRDLDTGCGDGAGAKA